jgi:hypothetical protein
MPVLLGERQILVDSFVSAHKLRLLGQGVTDVRALRVPVCFVTLRMRRVNVMLIDGHVDLVHDARV